MIHFVKDIVQISQATMMQSCHKLTYDLKVHGVVHGQRKGKEVKWVEASTNVATGFALDLRPKLTMEQVHHNRAVSSQMILPRLTWHSEHEMWGHYFEDHNFSAIIFLTCSNYYKWYYNKWIPHITHKIVLYICE